MTEIGNMTKTKTCPRCRVAKPLDAFGFNKLAKDGRHYQCRNCIGIDYRIERLERGFRLKIKTADGFRHCGLCNTVKPLEQFYRNRAKKDGRRFGCIECTQARRVAARPPKPECPPKPERPPKPEPPPEGFKRCSGCLVLKPLEAFSRERRTRDGYRYRCRACCSVAYYDRQERKGLQPKARAPEGMRYCSGCDAIRPLEAFYVSGSQGGKVIKDGRYYVCKNCQRQRGRDRTGRPRPERPPEGFKRCSGCHEVKLIEEFNRNRANGDGLQHACRVCTKALTAALRQAAAPD